MSAVGEGAFFLDAGDGGREPALGGRRWEASSGQKLLVDGGSRLAVARPKGGEGRGAEVVVGRGASGG